MIRLRTLCGYLLPFSVVVPYTTAIVQFHILFDPSMVNVTFSHQVAWQSDTTEFYSSHKIGMPFYFRDLMWNIFYRRLLRIMSSGPTSCIRQSSHFSILIQTFPTSIVSVEAEIQDCDQLANLQVYDGPLVQMPKLHISCFKRQNSSHSHQLLLIVTESYFLDVEKSQIVFRYLNKHGRKYFIATKKGLSLRITSDNAPVFHRVYRFVTLIPVLSFVHKVTVHKWQGYEDPGCSLGGFVIFRQWINLYHYDLKFIVPPLMCHRKLATLFNKDAHIPHTLTSAASARKSNISHLVVYAYFPFSFIDLTFETHPLNRLARPLLYPCLYSYLKTKGTNRSKAFILQQERLPNGIMRGSSSSFKMSAYYSIFQPVFFGRLKQCSLLVEEESLTQTFHYIINYYSPKAPYTVHCPAYLHYKQANWEQQRSFTNVSGEDYVVVDSQHSLYINFSQGCQWYGASFSLILVSSSHASNVYYMKEKRHLSLSHDNFTVVIPIISGRYEINTFKATFFVKGDVMKISLTPHCKNTSNLHSVLPLKSVKFATVYYILKDIKRTYLGIHDPFGVVNRMKVAEPNLRASGLYYKISEFNNLTNLEWTTHQREVVLIVDIDDQQPSIHTCQINVSAIIQSQTSLLGAAVKKGFHIHYLSPIVFPTDHVPSTDTYNVLNHAHGGSTWVEANDHCQSLGGELHGASSNDERHRIFYNVHYIYQRQHFHFWKSQIIFLGRKDMVSILHGEKHYLYL